MDIFHNNPLFSGIRQMLRAFATQQIRPIAVLCAVLGAPRSLRAGSPTLATDLLIADVDGDGANDIVTWDGFSSITSTPSHTVSIHRQSSTAGMFAAAQSFAVPNLVGVAAGKLDGDARIDLVIQSAGAPAEAFAYLASATTAGTYIKGALIKSDGLGELVVSHVLDIDQDGFDDVAVAQDSGSGGGLEIRFNNHPQSPGTFAAPMYVGAGRVGNASFGHYTGATSRQDVVLFGSVDEPTGSGSLFAPGRAHLNPIEIDHLRECDRHAARRRDRVSGCQARRSRPPSTRCSPPSARSLTRGSSERVLIRW